MASERHANPGSQGARSGRAGRLRAGICGTLLAASAMLPATALAHPHIWVDALVVVEADDGMIRGLDMTFVFDAFYSLLVIEDFDDNRDGTLDAPELEILAREIRENLRYVEFFTRIHVDGTPIRVDDVDSVRADLRDDDTLALHLQIALPMPVDPRHNEFALAIYDDTHYVSILLDEFEPIHTAGQLPEGCRFDVQPATDSARYEGVGALFAQYARTICNG